MKKNTLTIVGIMAIAVHSFAQQPSFVYPKIQEVTVYLSGAEVRSQETVPLKKGENTIVWRGLSPSLIHNSVQITVGNGVDILSVSTKPAELKPEVLSPGVKTIKDSIRTLEDQIEVISNQIDAYEVEKQTLKHNQHLGGAQAAGVLLTELAKAADFFRERTLKINNALTALNKKLKQLNESLVEKNNSLNREVGKIQLRRYNVEVMVNSKTDQQGEFLLRHLIADASWEPSYDIVAGEINKPVTLKYKAQIFNHSGIDWRNVKLTLSTGDITMDASRPYLTSWTLSYTSSANEGFLNSMVQNRDTTGFSATEEKTVSELNTSFVIEQRHSVRADGEPYRIELQTEKLDAAFEYLTIPKMELSAFLIAKITGWEKLNLIDGTANVYFGNTFIGESAINTRLIGDTLEVSFGRDNQIVVNRTKIEDKGATPSLAGKRSESFVYELQLRNNRNVPVLIKIQDQVPVSQEKDITVEVEEISNAVLDGSSGRLQWIKTLGPGETLKNKIAFTVRYPKNRTVNIRKSRVVRTPRYKH